MNNWRFRFLISCFTLLPEEFVISDYKLCCKKDGRNISGDIIYRIDIFTKTPDIQKAFSECLDLVDEVLDRIAFLANSKVGLLSIVSITRPYVKSEQEFEVGVPTGSFSNSNADISRQHLEDFSVDDLKSRLMRCFRLGCSSADSYTRYKNLWLLLELLAEQKAKDEGWKLDKKCHKCEEVIHCPKCGVESPVIPDQQRGIIYFLSRFSVDNKHTPEEIAKNGRRLRGKLIHGGKLSNLKLADEVSAMTVAIYATVLSSLSEYLNKNGSLSREQRNQVANFMEQVMKYGTVKDSREQNFVGSNLIDVMKEGIRDKGITEEQVQLLANGDFTVQAYLGLVKDGQSIA